MVVPTRCPQEALTCSLHHSPEYRVDERVHHLYRLLNLSKSMRVGRVFQQARIQTRIPILLHLRLLTHQMARQIDSFLRRLWLSLMSCVSYLDLRSYSKVQSNSLTLHSKNTLATLTLSWLLLFMSVECCTMLALRTWTMRDEMFEYLA